jgi:endonuclease YncB( thermonuclease family)
MGLKRVLLGVTFTAVMTASSAFGFEPGKAYECTKVVDGDTAYFKGLENSVRFLIVNTAERGQEPYYSDAKEFTEDALLGKKVVLQTDPPYSEPEVARSGRGDRWLAVPIVKGNDICEKLIESGLSRYYIKHTDSDNPEKYIRAQKKAMLSNRGNWDYGEWPLPNDGGIELHVRNYYNSMRSD